MAEKAKKDGGRDSGSAFGQEHPPLYIYIKRILERYPGGQIFKEIIQNADDAGARNVTFYLDNRTHGTDSLIVPGLDKFQGPALLAYNDAKFTATDWESIQKPEQSGKEKDPFKVGKFGLGFNSVYHITDLPTIISGPNIAFMEPQGKVWPGKAGRQYTITSPKMQPTLAPFNEISGFSTGMATYPYTLFRFPLRSHHSDLSQKRYDIPKLKELLDALKDEAEYLLIFLRSVVVVRVVEISTSGDHNTLFEVSISSCDRDIVSQKRHDFIQKVKSSNTKSRKTPYKICYEAKFHITVENRDSEQSLEKHWLVTTTVGSDDPQDLHSANKQDVLPWVGCALELDNETVYDSNGGRIFCFLPLPHETCSPLPVHVNGTFGLNDNRRTVKWPSKERKHDSTADWNMTIVKSLLPYCYFLLIKSAINEGIPVDDVYSSWPQCDKLKRTPWAVLMQPLFDILFQPDSEVLWSSRFHGITDGRWVSLQNATIITSSETSAIVHETLSACGLQLVDYTHHPHIQEAVRVANKRVTELSPFLARRCIRSKTGLRYQDLPPSTKYELLHYCLLDGKFNELEGLELLPLANGSFVMFEHCQVTPDNHCYVCNDRHNAELLPGLQYRLVDVSNHNLDLHKELLKVASSNKSQLRKLNPDIVASLLPQCMPPEWINKTVTTISGSVISSDWFVRFWDWILKNNLDLFKDKMVLPVVKQCSQRSELCIARLVSKSTVIFVNENSILDTDTSLREGLEKFDVYFTGTLENLFPYLQYCKSLKEYVNSTTKEGILRALRNAYDSDEKLQSLQSIKVTPKEAESIQQFLTDLHSQQRVLMHLPIFKCVNKSSLHSIATAARGSWKGKAVILTSSIECSTDLLPTNVVILCSTHHQKRLVELYKDDFVNRLDWVDFVLKYLFPMILTNDYPQCKVELLMKEIIEQLPSLKPHHRDSLQREIENIPFLRRDSKGTLVPPCKLFDPSKRLLVNMLPADMFPTEPFNKPPLLQQLCGCGLRQTLTAQEVVNLIYSISSRKSTNTAASQAKAVLAYLESNKSLMEKRVQYESEDVHLKRAIQDISKQRKWLPQQPIPPEYYPSCLGWKGKSFPKLVSLGQETLVCSPKSMERDCLTVGSTMCIVPCPASVSTFLKSSVRVDNVVKHFIEVIKYCDKLGESDAYNSIVEYIYEFLQNKRDSYNELRHSLPQRWIWIKKTHTFLSTKSVCLTHASLQHDLEPYMYVLPESLQRFANFFKAMGVKETITRAQLVKVLATISEGASEMNNEEALVTVMAILASLTRHGTQPVELKSHEILYVPIKSEHLQLEESTKVCYADVEFLQEFISTSENEDMYILCHESIRYMAHQLHLTPLSEHLELSEDLFEDFGQHESLILRLKNILRDYTDGLTIVKELLQNADDAEATEVNLCYDARQHSVNPKTLLYSGMNECSGPALVVHNDAQFTDDDFQNITRLAAATKKDKPLKIGKFGVGFCSVYHITDVPSFVSRQYLYIFDPTLQYLGEHVRDKSRPGKRLNFTKKIATYSKQLAPFVGLNGFDTKAPFKGTMFRFPFRTSASEISPVKYTEYHIKQLVKDIQECGPKLLLFLQNVRRITFSSITESDKTLRVLLDISKESVQSLSSTETDMIHIRTVCDGNETALSQQWLVGNYTRIIDFGGRECDALSSVACLMSSSAELSDSEQLSVKQVDGEVFCFLPLSVRSGLPVHVSANFAVMNDRTGIRSSDEHSSCANEAEWNVDLMKHIIPQAYFNLLLYLSKMYMEGAIGEEYRCYSLLPLKTNLTVHNPWDFLIQPLYSFTSENRILFSPFIKSWLTLSESMFLSPNILFTGRDVTHCVHECVQLLKLPVVDLSPEYEVHLPPHLSTEELDFVRLFFERVIELQPHYKIRNNIIKLILEAYLHAEPKKAALEEILQRTKCIPCSPNGEQLKHCNDVIDPRAFFAGLYEANDQVFPAKEFQKFPTNQALIALGMVSKTLPLSKVAEQANTVEALYSSNDQCKALQRSKIILKCVSHLPPSTQYVNRTQWQDLERIKAIRFIPVMQRPYNYPEFLSWEGDNHTMLAPHQIYYGRKCCHLAGSKVCVACTADPKSGGCGGIEREVISTLGIKEKPEYTYIVSHFRHIIEEVTSKQENCSSSNTEWITEACSEIYQFLENILRHNGVVDMHELKNCVWTGSQFVSPNVVASDSTWPQNGPYLYHVPSILADKEYLMAALEIKPQFSLNTLVETLEKIGNEYRHRTVDKNCQDFLFLLVARFSLRMKGKVDYRKFNCYLPDSNLVMRRATDLDYDDAEWLKPEESSGANVHRSIPTDMAIKLGVRPIRAKMFDAYEDQYDGVAFGQSENLTRRIKNILEDYPLDITLLKELLQNADDAKATKMFIILDKRTHGMNKVPSDEWRDLQGPSLLVWNDSTFREEDMTGIQKLGLGSKRSESETIGMYGIGFNVVYHLTDCPSFISTEKDGNSTLCILDPHCRYIPGAKRQKPGRRFNNLDQKFWMQWSDMGSAYLQSDSLTEDIKCGSLFRFPLRHKQDLIEKSQLVTETSEPIDAQKMEAYLRRWAPDMRESLFFLNSVTELQFFVIDTNNMVSQTHHYKVTIDDKGQQCRARMQERVHLFSTGNPTPHVETYTLTLTGKEIGLRPEKWLIQQGVGDIQKPTQYWQYLPRMKPKHGIAAPLCGSDREMHVFCFLPLPTKSHLPVHINGSFALNSSRRQLWQPTSRYMDDKAKWNLNLMEAIASSYAHLLETFKETFISNRTLDLLQQSIHWYYKTFPVWLPQCGEAPEGECLILAKLVYDILHKKNASILVHLHETEKGVWHVKFLPLTNDKEPWNQPYFYDRQSEGLSAILRKIGMQLTEAPDVIYEHFANRKIELSRVTQQSVFKYYSKFHSSSTELDQPSHISETKFGSVKDFKIFTEYILLASDDGPLRYPESPFGKPLLLTADVHLRKFDPNNKVVRTQFSELFIDSRYMFLHPEMMDVNYVKDYFLKPCQQCWDTVHRVFSSKLPIELQCEVVSHAQTYLTHDNLTKIWKCLSKENFFLIHLKKILETWALIPSKSKELFSLKCSYLPIMEDTQTHIDPYNMYNPTYVQRNLRDIFRIFGKLGMPQVDVTIVQEELAEKFSPKISDAARVINNLFDLHQKRKILDNIASDVSVIKPLLQYCCTIPLGADRQSLSIIKALPLFRSIDGRYCSIQNGAYIWPKDMCNAGKDLWLQGCRCVFLDADGEWTCLNTSKLLGIKEISSFKVYSTFIFPFFNNLQEQQRMRHLEVIRDSMYDVAENYTKVSYMGDFGMESDAGEFITCLKRLCFIPRSDETLHPVGDFTDPRKKLFDTFRHHFQFPPSNLRSDEWLNFLVKIGLRTSITAKEYLQFCQEVNLGKHPNLQTASRVLIDHLFQEKNWHKETYFLENVSKIPFVCAETLPSVKWIHACAPPGNVVKQSNCTVNLTSLSKAADHKYYKLIWTVRPVVRLPSYPEYSHEIARQKRKELLLSLKVSKVTQVEVIRNIQNVSTTKFSDFQNFETYSCDKTPKDGIDLLEVLRANYEFLKDAGLNVDLTPLKNTACIPVCAEGRIDVVKCPVLVKPIQAIALANDSLREFMPFLSRLPSEFYSILPNILTTIGVEQAIMLKHIQGALETIHIYTDQELDVNSQSNVRNLIRKLYELLYNQQSPGEFTSEKVLYLPNSKNTLVDSRTLLYQDCEHFRRTTLKFEASRYSELHLLVTKREHSLHYKFHEKDLCNLLPSEIAPKPLTTSCREVMSSNCKPETSPSQLVKDLTRACKLTQLAAGACAILRHNSNPREICEKLKGSLEQFFKNCHIFSVKHLTVDLLLEVEQPAEHIGTAEVDFHIEKKTATTFHLYIDKEARKILFFENLSTAILCWAADMCGVSINAIREPQAALTHLLKAESSSQIRSTLKDIGIKDYSMGVGGEDDFTEEFNPTLKPVLGIPIPESWHHRLQQDYNNLFRPGEWVGYEKEDDCIVFALIGYKIQEESDETFAHYSIYIEEGEQEENMIVVSVLDIYKIRRSAVRKQRVDVHVREMMAYEGHGDEQSEEAAEEQVPKSLIEIKKEICEELKRIWKLSDDMKRKAIKRMYLKWHPDKNLHNTELAGEAFKFLKQQIERLEKGLPMDDPDKPEKDSTQHRDFTSDFWGSFFRTWDHTARNHHRYQQSEWRSSSDSSSGTSDYGQRSSFNFNFPDTTPDIDKARKWIKQAQCDYKALSVLSEHCCPEVCANICFLSHEVAEKSLKAGMLVVWGLRPADFTNHKKLNIFALNLEQKYPHLSLVAHVLSLPTERYYYKTRWPNMYGPHHEVPAEQFDVSLAFEAKAAAGAILNAILQIIQ